MHALRHRAAPAIRLDTPEGVDARKPVQGFGREAGAHAHALLDGQPVQVEPTGAAHAVSQVACGAIVT
jgi:hypothetical protein